MKNKYFPDEEITENDLFFICSMVERVARKLRRRNKYVVNAIGYDELVHLLRCAAVLPCEKPQKVPDDGIRDYSLTPGDFDITDVDRQLCTKIPSENDMGKVYKRLIVNTSNSHEDYAEGILRVYNDEICETLDNYNASAYYEPSYIVARAYFEKGFH